MLTYSDPFSGIKNPSLNHLYPDGQDPFVYECSLVLPSPPYYKVCTLPVWLLNIIPPLRGAAPLPHVRNSMIKSKSRSKLICPGPENILPCWSCPSFQSTPGKTTEACSSILNIKDGKKKSSKTNNLSYIGLA